MKKRFSLILMLIVLITSMNFVYADTVSEQISSFRDSDVNFMSVSHYKDYMYSISKKGLTVIDLSDIKNPVDVTDRSNPDITSTVNNGQEATNTYTYVYGDYLYALVSDQKQLRRFSLENPSEPVLSRTYQLSGTGNMYYMAVSGSFAYIATEGSLVSVNLNSGAYRTVTGTSYRVIKIHNGYLFSGGYSGLDIYDLSTSMSAPNRIYSNNLQYGSSSQRVIMDFGFAGDYCIFTTYSANDWMKRNIWSLDISDMNNLSSREFVKFKSGDTMSRINTIAMRNGLMFISDIDNAIHIFDVENMPELTEVGKIDASGNPYSMVIDGDYIYLSTFSGYLAVYDLICDNLELESEYVSEKNPIEITGKAKGSNSVIVCIDGIEKVIPVDGLGRFSAEFDDEFIDNGVYTIKVSIVRGNEVIKEENAALTVDHMPKFNISAGETTETDDAVVQQISVTNNTASAEKLYFVSAAYKGDMMTDYSVASYELDGGKQYDFLGKVSAENADTVKSYLLGKKGENYILLWSGEAYGNELPRETVSLPEGADKEINVIHEEKHVTMAFESEAKEDGVVLVYKPQMYDIETGLEYIGIAGKENNLSVSFTLSEPAIEDMDYRAVTAAKCNGKYEYLSADFRYFGEVTLQPILKSIKDSDKNTIEKILFDNSDKLSIDMSPESAYASLGGEYKKNVLSVFAGADYTAAGSLKLKQDFNRAVDEQVKLQKYDADCANALREFNAAVTAEDIERVFDKNAVFELKYGETYFWSGAVKDKVLTRLINKMPYKSISDVAHDFMRFGAIEYINNTPYNELDKAFDKTYNTLGMKFSSEFNSFSEKNKAYVYKEISLGFDYDTPEDLQNAINSAIEYVYGKYVKTEKGTSGGGGGGGAPKHKSVYPVTANPEVTELKPDKTAVFSDIGNVEWAKEAILNLAESGIIDGRGEGIFDPDGNVTREELVKMAVEAFGIPTDINGEMGFKDVNQTDWSMKYISAAYNAGLINGVSKDMFMPKQNISRQDMCVILFKILAREGMQPENDDISAFTDYDSISDYSTEAVSALYGSGLINGTGDNTFEPLAPATRAMAAKLIYECMQYIKSLSVN
ncbi:MAG: S-layer homology domain-containing protein [Clostridia bacterium]|nr:S-layer homology domain-containing protein [Clostridia bacterium]